MAIAYWWDSGDMASTYDAWLTDGVAVEPTWTAVPRLLVRMWLEQLIENNDDNPLFHKLWVWEMFRMGEDFVAHPALLLLSSSQAMSKVREAQSLCEELDDFEDAGHGFTFLQNANGTFLVKEISRSEAVHAVRHTWLVSLSLQLAWSVLLFQTHVIAMLYTCHCTPATRHAGFATKFSCVCQEGEAAVPWQVRWQVWGIGSRGWAVKWWECWGFLDKIITKLRVSGIALVMILGQSLIVRDFYWQRRVSISQK